MIGSRVAFVAPRPVAALASLGAAAAASVLGLALGAPILVGLALLPAAIGAGLLWTSNRRFRARFTPTALEVARPAQSLPYARILEVRPVVPLGAARPRAFAIEVVHAGGTLLIPASLSVPSERVYAFLQQYLPARPGGALPAPLAAFQQEQEARFGPDRVFVYGGRRGTSGRRRDGLRGVGLGFLVAGLAWLATPWLRPSEPAWYAAGAASLVTGGLLVMIEALERRGAGRGRSTPRTTGLVISPLGLALEQGALNGLMTWAEIRKVSVQAKSASGVDWSTPQERGPGIVLEVEGAQVRITDSYDRPLAEIHEKIQRYWR